MTEATIDNIFQTVNQDFSTSENNKSQNNSTRSFSETMKKINQSRQKSKKSVDKKGGKTVKEKLSSLSNQEFLAKLKKILNKNKKEEVPSELFALLEGGSLNSQQQAMLEKMMLNLKNNNLDISKLKSLLVKNSDDLGAENSDKLQFLGQEKKGENLDLKSLSADQLEKLSALLETEDQSLTQADSSKLNTELDQLAKILMNSNSGDSKKVQKNLEQLLGAEEVQAKLAELTSTLKENNFNSEDFAKITEEQKVQFPLLKKALVSESLDFGNLEATFNPENNSSIFSELAAQLKEMLNEENTKLNNQNQKTDLNLNNSDLFSLNNDSVLDLAFEGGELESKNQNNFFDLDNSNLLFNFDLENQSSANNNLNVENFNIPNQNTAKLAENADLRAQIVEQFRGEYSPETKEMQVQLKPKSLGKINISLSYDNEQLTGKMLVESEMVRAQLENSLKGLKSDLLKQGINIEQFKIKTAKNSPQQVENQDKFAFNDQDSAFSDGETGQNQEYEQRQFFQGQYYVQRNNSNSNLENENIIMRQQEIINRAAFSSEKLNLLA